MTDNTKKILTYISLGLVVGIASAVAYRKYKARKGEYVSNAKNNTLDADMEALIKKISEVKK